MHKRPSVTRSHCDGNVDSALDLLIVRRNAPDYICYNFCAPLFEVTAILSPHCVTIIMAIEREILLHATQLKKISFPSKFAEMLVKS